MRRPVLINRHLIVVQDCLFFWMVNEWPWSVEFVGRGKSRFMEEHMLRTFPALCISRSQRVALPVYDQDTDTMLENFPLFTNPAFVVVYHFMDLSI